MCKLCDEGIPRDHTGSVRESRRDFLKTAAVTGVAAAGLDLFATRAAASDGEGPPENSGPAGDMSSAAAP